VSNAEEEQASACIKFRARHGAVAPAREDNYRAAMAMIGMSDDRAHGRRSHDRAP
jgi:hypothetical protein